MRRLGLRLQQEGLRSDSKKDFLNGGEYAGVCLGTGSPGRGSCHEGGAVSSGMTW